jgi:hypothetical protein
VIWNRAQSFHKNITGPPQKTRTHDELSGQNRKIKNIPERTPTAEHFIKRRAARNRNEFRRAKQQQPGFVSHRCLLSIAPFMTRPINSSFAREATEVLTNMGRHFCAHNNPDCVISIE